MMPDVTEVFIQDPEPQGKIEIVREILSQTHSEKVQEIDVEGRTGTEQFFIPNAIVP